MEGYLGLCEFSGCDLAYFPVVAHYPVAYVMVLSNLSRRNIAVLWFKTFHHIVESGR